MIWIGTRSRGVAVAMAAAAALSQGCGGIDINGPPELEVGTGEYAFEPVVDGIEVPIIYGPQGGQHIWLGIRVENMNPRRFHIESRMVDVVQNTPVGERLFFDVNLFEGTSGSLEFAGLPHQLEPSAVKGLLIRVDVFATDRDGRDTEGSMEVVPLMQ